MLISSTPSEKVALTSSSFTQLPIRLRVDRGDAHRAAQEPVRAVSRNEGPDPLGERQRGELRGTRRQDGELVTTPSRTDIRLT
jgi:hypothetical protein